MIPGSRAITELLEIVSCFIIGTCSLKQLDNGGNLNLALDTVINDLLTSLGSNTNSFSVENIILGHE
jgi:hypothetical protein